MEVAPTGGIRHINHIEDLIRIKPSVKSYKKEKGNLFKSITPLDKIKHPTNRFEPQGIIRLRDLKCKLGVGCGPQLMKGQ